MRINNLVILTVLLSLAQFCVNQAPPTPYLPIQRLLTNEGTVGSETVYSAYDQVLPRCSTAVYTFSPGPTCSKASDGTLLFTNYVLEFVPLDTLAPFPSNLVTLEFSAMLSSSSSVSPAPSGVLNSRLTSFPHADYLGENYCYTAANISLSATPSSMMIVAPFPQPVSANTSCGYLFYSNNLCQSNTTGEFSVTITTKSSENSQGIAFNLVVITQTVSMESFNFSNPYVALVDPQVQSSSNDTLFVPTEYQDLYFLDVTPPTSFFNLAAFQANSSGFAELIITIDQLQITNDYFKYYDCFGTFDLVAGLGEEAYVFGLGRTLFSEFPGASNFSTHGDFCKNNSISLSLGHCFDFSSSQRLFIAVAYPTDTNFTFTYQISAAWVALPDRAIPQYQYLNAKTAAPISSQLGLYDSTSGEYQYDFYLLTNITSNADLVIYLYNIEGGSATASLTTNALGFGAACSPSAGAMTCSSDTYCTIVVPSCSLSTSAIYWLTIKVLPTSFIVSYTVAIESRPIVTKSITTLPSISNSIYTVYYDTFSVGKSQYIHYETDLSYINLVQNHSIRAVIYPNHEEHALMFFYNPDSPAGSEYIYYNGSIPTSSSNDVFPMDSCYSAQYHCATSSQNALPRPDFINANTNSQSPDRITGSCTVNLAFCDLVIVNQAYFSVFGGNFNDNHGYNYSTEYTVAFYFFNTPYSGEFNTVYSENVPVPASLYGTLENYYTNQYMFVIPDDLNDVLSHSIRIRVFNPDFGNNDPFILKAFLSCDQLSGDCGCFNFPDQYCSLLADSLKFGETFCDLRIPLCNCPSRTFYFSLKAENPNTNTFGTSIQANFMAYIEQDLIMENVTTVPTRIDQSILPVPNADLYPLTIDDNLRYLYGNDLFRVPSILIQDLMQNNYGLEIRVSYVTRLHANNNFVLLSASQGSVPAPVNPQTELYDHSSCARHCFAYDTTVGIPYQGNSDCTIVFEPCDLTGEDILLRVSGYSHIVNQDTNVKGVDYTLDIKFLDYSIIAGELNTPLRNMTIQGQSKRYSFDISTLNGEESLQVRLFKDADQLGDLSLFYSFDQPAGPIGGCYSREGECYLYQTRSFCDFFFAPCELVGRSVLYVTVFGTYSDPTLRVPSFSSTTVVSQPDDNSAIGGNDLFENQFESINHIFKSRQLIYTLSAKTNGIVSLDGGAPVIGSLYYREEAYYTFTIPTNPGSSIFRLHLVDMVSTTSTYSLVTYISSQAPGGQVCGCSQEYFFNEFDTIDFPCTLLGNSGQYFVKVVALTSGETLDKDPVVFTIRAWLQNVMAVSLPLSTNFTAPPAPLNYLDVVDYSITLPGNSINPGQVLVIEIANLTNTVNISSSGILAVINTGNMASPSANHYPSTNQSLFSPNNPCQYFDVCTAVNTGLNSSFNSTVVCRFTYTLCNICNFTSLHLTVYSGLVIPQAAYSRRMNFTVRAYLDDIPTPTNFPPSSDFYSEALSSLGFTYNFSAGGLPPVLTYSTFGTTVKFAYYFQLPSLSLSNSQTLELSLSGEANANLIYNTVSNGVCTTLTGVSGCQAGATYTLYGIIYANDETEFSLNNVSLTFVIGDTNIYSQVPDITLNVPDAYNDFLYPGQYRIFSLAQALVDPSVVPIINVHVNSTVGEVTTCFSYDQANLNFSCSQCLQQSIQIQSCCVGATQVLYIVVYNSNFNSVGADFTVYVDITYLGAGYSALSLPAQSLTGLISNASQYQFYSFVLSSDVFARDSVLNFRMTPSAGSSGAQTVYLNFGDYAGQNNDSCVSNFFSCVAGTPQCFVQLPFCFFGQQYGTYYLGINGPNDFANSGTDYYLFIQDVTELQVDSSAISGTVPDAPFASIDTLTFFKFQYTRTLNDIGVAGQNYGLKLTLDTTNLNVNNSLELYISDSRFISGTNVLAGPPTAYEDVLNTSCLYNSDFTSWTCDAVSTPVSGGIVNCYAAFCDNAAFFNQQSSSQYIYVSVKNVEISDSLRLPTDFYLSVSYTSDVLPTNEVLFQMVDANINADAIFTGGCVENLVITGGCDFNQTDFPAVNTSFFQIDMTDISTYSPVDYFILNVTSYTDFLNISYWFSDRCGPSSSNHFSCETTNTECVFTLDYNHFQNLAFADGNGTLDAIETRYLYFQFVWTGAVNFHVEFRRVTPPEYVIQLNSGVLSYSQEFVTWSNRYALFNIEVPQNNRWTTTISFNSSCEGSGTFQVLYTHNSGYQHPSLTLSGDGQFQLSSQNSSNSFTIPACYSGGNTFVSVYYTGSLLTSEVVGDEGPLSPQPMFTITATISEATLFELVPFQTLILEQNSTIVHFRIEEDHPGFYPYLNVNTFDQQVYEVRVITPAYFATFGNIYSFTDLNCNLPACNTPGVLCNQFSGLYTFNIDCALPGNYYVFFSNTGNAIINSSISLNLYYARLDVPVYNLTKANNYNTVIEDIATLVNTGAGSYEQIYLYKIVTDGGNRFLDFNLTFPDLEAGLFQYYEECLFNINCTQPETFNPTFNINIFDELTFDQCSSAIVDETTSYPYGIRDFTTGCNSSVYFIQVIAKLPNYQSQNISFRIELNAGFVNLSDFNYQVVTPGEQVCGSVWGIAANEFLTRVPYIENGRYQSNVAFNDRGNLRYPFVSLFYLDLSSVNLNTIPSIEIDFSSYSTIQNGLVFNYGTEPGGRFCSSCLISDTVQLENTKGVYQTIIKLEILCPLPSQGLWASVWSQSVDNLAPSDFEFSFKVNNPTTVGFVVPSSLANNQQMTFTANTTNAATTYYLDNTLQYFSIVQVSAPGSTFYITKGSVAQENSCGSCSSEATNCRLSEASIYYIPATTSYTYQSCNLGYNSEISVVVQGVQKVVPGTSYTASLCSSNFNSLYVIDSSLVDSNTLISYTFSFLNFENGYPIARLSCGDLYCSTSSQLTSFLNTTSGTYSVTIGPSCSSTCSSVFIELSTETYCSLSIGQQCTSVEFIVEANYNSPISTLTPLTPVWAGDSIPYFANANLEKTYSISTTSDGFVHVAIGNCNGTESLGLSLFEGYNYLFESNCPFTTCNCAQGASQSCFLYHTANAGTLFSAQALSIDNGIVDYNFAGALYRIEGFNSFIQLTSKIPVADQLQGRNIHYYKFNSRIGGISTGAPQSVYVQLSLMSGPPLSVFVADRNDLPMFMSDLITYPSYYHEYVCLFGNCTYEISSIAAHPGSSVLYVYVSTDMSNPIEVPSNYQLQVNLGTDNCILGNNLNNSVTFCQQSLDRTSLYWNPSNATYTDESAIFYNQTLFDLYACAAPLAACTNALARFACISRFRECDSNGFYVPVCRRECTTLVEGCSAAEYYEYNSFLNCNQMAFVNDEPCSGIGATIPSPIFVSPTAFPTIALVQETFAPTVSPRPLPSIENGAGSLFSTSFFLLGLITTLICSILL